MILSGNFCMTTPSHNKAVWLHRLFQASPSPTVHHNHCTLLQVIFFEVTSFRNMTVLKFLEVKLEGRNPAYV